MKVQTKIVPCEAITCQNGGTAVNGVSCRCTNEYTGPRCERFLGE